MPGERDTPESVAAMAGRIMHKDAADMLRRYAALLAAPSPAVAEVRCFPAEGQTLAEMRELARWSCLYQHGAMRLMWVNEEDLAALARLSAEEERADG